MPEIRSQYVQFLILLLALPAQYLLTQLYGANSDSQRIGHLSDMIKSSKEMWSSTERFLGTVWKNILTTSMFGIDVLPLRKSKSKRFWPPVLSNVNGECTAKEVLKFRSLKGFFAQSTAVRSPRPSIVKFRVGQVIKHKVFGYRGVIIGWDSSCKASKAWRDRAYIREETFINQPHYLILVDRRDRPGIQTTYVAQDKLAVFTNMDVKHPNLWDYFQLYDGAQYHMRPAIHQIYPHD